VTRFLRELSAIILHRSANALIACAFGLQRLGFRAQFGSEWRTRRDQHYRHGITRKHWEMQLDEATASLDEVDGWIDQVKAHAAEVKAFRAQIKADLPEAHKAAEAQ
jgi:hypothetical protein